MAVLTSNQRSALRARYGEVLSARRDPFALTKAQLDAAIAAADDWVEANAASFNTALPAAARAGLTAAQKAELLSLVANKRFGG